MVAFVRTILLSLSVFVANAYCACAGGDVPAPAQASCCAAKSSPSCHGAVPTEEAPCEKGDPAHNCGHCTGSVTADTAAKTVVPPLVGASFIGVPDACAGVTAFSRCHPHEHAGLSPPVAAPTLLNLSCSLNN